MSIKHLLLAATLLAGTHLGHAARAAEEVAICTGGKSGVYYGAGQTIAAAADKSQVTIKPVETKGSWENLGLVAEGKTCKAAIVQSDAIPAFARARASDARVLTRASTLHREYVHALCNRRAGIDNLYYVDAKHPVAVGESGSGSWVTFQNWISYDKDRYGVVPLVFEGGIIGAGLAAEGSAVSCMIYDVGLRSGDMNKINDRYGDQLMLVPATGRVFRDAKDERGNPLYEMLEIPSGTYPALQPAGMLYGTKAVEVPTQRAVVVVNREALGSANFAALMDAVSKARAKILADSGETR